MTINKPVWFEYVVWDYTDKWNPKIKGFKEDTPKEIVEQFKKDQRAYRKA